MNILDIFYNHIIYEAMSGRIDCLSTFNVPFSTNINGKIYECFLLDNSLMIPTLMIKDKAEFDRLLIEYVTLAKKFYSDDNYDDEIIKSEIPNNDKMISKEKVIMTLLFANATSDDFNDPCAFLRKRISFIENHNDMEKMIGNSKILGGNINIEIKKDKIYNETPSEMVISVTDGNSSFIFPRIKFGIDEDKIYIYAIQNKVNEKTEFVKKVNRRLYKVGEGFTKDDSEENLEDITASFLVALNIFINYFNRMGYSKFDVVSILPTRWNAKRMANVMKNKYFNKDINELDSKQEYIQNNLTNKLVRTILRLSCHYNNMDIVALPYDIDASLHMVVNDNDVRCNNMLLYETGAIVRKDDVKKGR
jgi:hypothetical protein